MGDLFKQLGEFIFLALTGPVLFLFILIATGYLDKEKLTSEEDYIELASEYGLTEKEALEFEIKERENVRKEFEYKGVEIRGIKDLRFQSEEIVREKIENYARENNITDPKTAKELREKAIKQAKGKLSGDLGCFSVEFIEEMTKKAEQFEEIIDVDCDTTVIDNSR